MWSTNDFQTMPLALRLIIAEYCAPNKREQVVSWLMNSGVHTACSHSGTNATVLRVISKNHMSFHRIYDDCGKKSKGSHKKNPMCDVHDICKRNLVSGGEVCIIFNERVCSNDSTPICTRLSIDDFILLLQNESNGMSSWKWFLQEFKEQIDGYEF